MDTVNMLFGICIVCIGYRICVTYALSVCCGVLHY